MARKTVNNSLNNMTKTKKSEYEALSAEFARYSEDVDYIDFIYVDKIVAKEELFEKLDEYNNRNNRAYESHKMINKLKCESQLEPRADFDLDIDLSKYTSQRSKEIIDDYYNAQQENAMTYFATSEPAILFNIADLGKDKSTFGYIKMVLETYAAEGFCPNVRLQMIKNSADLTEAVPTMFTPSEFKQLKSFQQFLLNEGLARSVSLQEGKGATPLSLKQVEDANKFVDAVVKNIKQLNFSPFETLVYVHDFCSQFYYNKGKDQYNPRILGDFVASGNIVCFGHATLEYEIIKRLGDKNLQATLCSGMFYQREAIHCIDKIQINDDKYGIHGTYFDDPCFDAPNADCEATSLTHCLLPNRDAMLVGNAYYFIKNNLHRVTDSLELYKKPVKTFSLEKLRDLHQDFMDTIEDCGEPVPIETYSKAYQIVLEKNGISRKQAKELTRDKIDFSIRMAHYLYGKDFPMINVFNNEPYDEFEDDFSPMDIDLQILKDEADLLKDEILNYDQESSPSSIKQLEREFEEKMEEARARKRELAAAGNLDNKKIIDAFLKELENEDYSKNK